jgi:hypothetical protein
MSRSLKTAFLPLLGLAALTACSEPPPTSGELSPFRGDWETVADYPLNDGGVSAVDGITEISIGGVQTGNNFANRGDVEVYFVDTAKEVPGIGVVRDHVIIQMREFTFAADETEAQADFDNLDPWMYPGSGSPSAPDNFMEGYDECNPRGPNGELALNGECAGSGAACLYDADCGGEAGSCVPTDILGWADQCQVRVYWKGQNQKLRVGADFRVFMPAAYEGRVNIVTEDNVQEAQNYPDLSDITIVDLAGTAFIDSDAANIDIRLSDAVEPVPVCDAMMQQECLDMGWTPMLTCATVCTDFGRVQIRPRGQQPIEINIDAPSSLWMTAKLTNTLPGLTADDECKVDIGGEIPEGAMASCGDFGTCECLDCESNLPFKRRVEINKPSIDSISGLGYSIDVESGDCAEKEFVTGPDDFMAPMTDLRGNLTLCSGCLDSLSAPAF